MSFQSYVGGSESEVFSQAQTQNPDGFEVLSIQITGYFLWRKVALSVRPLAIHAQKEMNQLRLMCAISSVRERRQNEMAQQEVMTHASEMNQQRQSHV